MSTTTKPRRETAADHMRHARLLEETGRSNEAANFYQSAILQVTAERDHLSAVIQSLTSKRDACLESRQ